MILQSFSLTELYLARLHATALLYNRWLSFNESAAIVKQIAL